MILLYLKAVFLTIGKITQTICCKCRKHVMIYGNRFWKSVMMSRRIWCKMRWISWWSLYQRDYGKNWLPHRWKSAPKCWSMGYGIWYWMGSFEADPVDERTALFWKRDQSISEKYWEYPEMRMQEVDECIKKAITFDTYVWSKRSNGGL